MAAKAESVQGTDTIKVVPKGAALSEAVKAICLEDIEAQLSARAIRNRLITAMVKEGRTAADFAKPEEGQCDIFYKEMVRLSTRAIAVKASDMGLTADEREQLADGVYNVSMVIDPDLKPAQLPGFVTEANRIGKLSIRRYWQQQKMVWFNSVRDSMVRYETGLKLLSGGAKERTKSVAERQIADLQKVLRRDANTEEPALLPNEIAYLKKLVARLAEAHGIELPAEDDGSNAGKDDSK